MLLPFSWFSNGRSASHATGHTEAELTLIGNKEYSATTDSAKLWNKRVGSEQL